MSCEWSSTNVSRRMVDISSTSAACVQYESCTDAKAILSLQARAVIIMCVASSEWIKLGGKAVAWARASTSAGMDGSTMKTVWRAVCTCRFLGLRYGWTTGRPSGVVQITLVICSLGMRERFGAGVARDALSCSCLPSSVEFLRTRLGASSWRAAWMRCGGIDLAMRRAHRLSHVWMPVAPLKMSPIESSTRRPR